MRTKEHAQSHQHPRVEFNTIVVGVDGSEHNQPAVGWACHEAEETKKTLVLIAGTEGLPMPTMPIPRFSSDYTVDSSEEQTRALLNRVRGEIKARTPNLDIATLVTVGKPADIIVESAEKADMVVVGKRGIGAVKRVLVGSTSIAVAGRSRVPVVVVPDQWVQTSHPGAPMVVGIDGSSRDQAVLEFALRRARDGAVPLIAVYAWQLPQIYSWSPEDIATWSKQAGDALEDKLQPLADLYPEVKIVRSHKPGSAVVELLEAANDAQLIVLGRHTPPDHLGGFAFGSTSRGVLHYSTCPVAVIPDQPDAADESDERQH